MSATGGGATPLNDADRALLASVGARIRKARNRLGLTQRELSEASGIHVTHISRLEAGTLNTRVATLRRVADAIKLTLPELLSEPGRPDE